MAADASDGEDGGAAERARASRGAGPSGRCAALWRARRRAYVFYTQSACQLHNTQQSVLGHSKQVLRDRRCCAGPVWPTLGSASARRACLQAAERREHDVEGAAASGRQAPRPRPAGAAAGADGAAARAQGRGRRAARGAAAAGGAGLPAVPGGRGGRQADDGDGGGQRALVPGAGGHGGAGGAGGPVSMCAPGLVQPRAAGLHAAGRGGGAGLGGCAASALAAAPCARVCELGGAPCARV